MSQGKSYKEFVDEQCSHSRPFTEPQILCPNCGCLSPVGTKKCDCGYKLRPSSTPYVITALVVVLLLAFSIGLIASGWSPRSDVTLAVPTPTAAPPSEPEPEPTLAPEPVYDFEPLSESATEYIYYQGDIYHHSRECPAFDVNMHFSYDRVHTLSGDYLKQSPCSVCVKKSRFKLTEITNLFYQGDKFHASRACAGFNSSKPFSASRLSDGVDYNFSPCLDCIVYNPVSVNNGQLICTPSEECLAPFSVTAPKDSACYVYMKCINSASSNAWATYDSHTSFYLSPGSSFSLDVPLGTYEIYYACGVDWYGARFLFGVDTTYSKCEGTFRFYDDGTYYQGWTLELYEQVNGNMDTEEISFADFPG